MSAVGPIAAVAPSPIEPLAMPIGGPAFATGAQASNAFANMLTAGLNSVDDKIGTADALVKSFALGDPVPIHQVTAALEEARLAVEVAMQVRSRLVETYREFMTMQV